MVYIHHQPHPLQVLGAPRLEDGQPGRILLLSGAPCQRFSTGLVRPSKGPHWMEKLDASVLALPRTQNLFASIEKDPCLSYSLPPVGSSAGQIIQHCQRVIKKKIELIKPATFKIGFSHNPAWRFNNAMYGYKIGKDRFEAMCVLWASCEPLPAAFLGASLIQLFQGDFP